MAQISPDSIASGTSFYLPNEASWSLLQELHDFHERGSVADHRYTNRHAWESILYTYFPNHYDHSLRDLQPPQTAQGTMYLIHRQFFDQAPPAERYGTGAGVTLERNTVDLPAHMEHPRDILWVKCSPPAPAGQSQSAWTSAMRTAVTYLGRRHPTRALYFILGVGVHWLPFYWDPTEPRAEGKALRMEAEGEGEDECEGGGSGGWYVVGPEVHAPPGFDAGHIDAEGVVHTDRAMSLDCFTPAGPLVAGEWPALAYQEDLDSLEGFLGVVAGRAYVGSHERSFGYVGEDERSSE